MFWKSVDPTPPIPPDCVGPQPFAGVQHSKPPLGQSTSAVMGRICCIGICDGKYAFCRRQSADILRVPSSITSSSIDTHAAVAMSTQSTSYQEWFFTASYSSAISTASSAAPQTHTISVGNGDFKFRPDVVQAQPGDTVVYQFYPQNHSVVRAEYLHPFIPYEMTGRGKVGFFTGFHPVDAMLHDVSAQPSTANCAADTVAWRALCC